MRPFNRGRGNVNEMSESRRETSRGGQRDRPGRNIERFENERGRNDERGDYRRSNPCEKKSDGYYDKNYREGRGSLRIEDRRKNDDFSQRTRCESGTFLNRKNDREYEYESVLIIVKLGVIVKTVLTMKMILVEKIMVVEKEIMKKIEKDLMNIENKITFKTTVQENRLTIIRKHFFMKDIRIVVTCLMILNLTEKGKLLVI